MSTAAAVQVDYIKLNPVCFWVRVFPDETLHFIKQTVFKRVKKQPCMHMAVNL